MCYSNQRISTKVDLVPNGNLVFLSHQDDLADDLEDVDFEDGGHGHDDEGWETEDEMEEDQDDSELTFSKHTGNPLPGFHAPQ